MGFTRESQMTIPVRRWLRRQRLLIKAEFALPWGICDLVALSFNQRQVAKRLSYRQYHPVGPMPRVELLRHIPDKESGEAITFERLQNSARATMFGSSVEHELRSLIANGFVVSNPEGHLQKLNGWAPMHDRIVAVELKLSRVSEALAQALSNRAFATESYVALPANVAARFAFGDRCAEFTKAGVGVLAVTTACCKVLLPAIGTSNADDTLQMHCVERFWRTRDNSSLIAERRAQVS